MYLTRPDNDASENNGRSLQAYLKTRGLIEVDGGKVIPGLLMVKGRYWYLYGRR